ncbi:hypothetical protein SLS59_006372 [Nothophoma quercina]|uniref:Uncharacterized protein n=1 Tax=Nothophoma quercina TaxID=749835 RepID=A0ABR3R4J2_9PLEO
MVEDSINLLVKNMISGKLDSILWSQVNDPKRLRDGASSIVPTAKQQIQAQVEQNLAELETAEEQDTVGDLPVADPAAYSVHFAYEEHKKAQDRSMTEQRKANAAAKRSGNVFGKIKKAASNVFSPEPENPLDEKLRKEKSQKTKGKNVKPATDIWKNKRGGKNASDSTSG